MKGKEKVKNVLVWDGLGWGGGVYAGSKHKAIFWALQNYQAPQSVAPQQTKTQQQQTNKQTHKQNTTKQIKIYFKKLKGSGGYAYTLLHCWVDSVTILHAILWLFDYLAIISVEHKGI